MVPRQGSDVTGTSHSAQLSLQVQECCKSYGCGGREGTRRRPPQINNNPKAGEGEGIRTRTRVCTCTPPKLGCRHRLGRRSPPPARIRPRPSRTGAATEGAPGCPGGVWGCVSASYPPVRLTAYFLPLVVEETASLSLFPATEFMVAFPSRERGLGVAATLLHPQSSDPAGFPPQTHPPKFWGGLLSPCQGW